MTAEPPAASQTAPAADKTRLRATMRTVRVGLGPARREEASAAACAALASLPELEGEGPFLLYAAFGDELNADALIAALRARNAQVALPRVRGEALELCLVTELSELAPGWRGVREPAAGAPPVEPGEVRAAVVPGLAFDAAGNRLGYGGGHFDRLLARLPARAPVIGVAFDAQIVAELPAEAHDRPVQVIVTESRIIRTR